MAHAGKYRVHIILMFIEVVNYPLDRGFKFVLCVFQMNKFRLQWLKNLLFQTNNGSYLAGAPLLGLAFSWSQSHVLVVFG